MGYALSGVWLNCVIPIVIGTYKEHWHCYYENQFTTQVGEIAHTCVVLTLLYGTIDVTWCIKIGVPAIYHIAVVYSYLRGSALGWEPTRSSTLIRQCVLNSTSKLLFKFWCIPCRHKYRAVLRRHWSDKSSCTGTTGLCAMKGPWVQQRLFRRRMNTN